MDPYTVTDMQLFYSDDDGQNWTETNVIWSGNESVMRHTFSLDKNVDNYLYLYGIGSGHAGFYAARVSYDKDAVIQLSNYEYLSGYTYDDNGVVTGATWSSDIVDAVTAGDTESGYYAPWDWSWKGAFDVQVFYNEHIDKYIAINSREGFYSHSINLKESPNPWGPFENLNLLQSTAYTDDLKSAYAPNVLEFQENGLMYYALSYYVGYNVYIMKNTLNSVACLDNDGDGYDDCSLGDTGDDGNEIDTDDTDNQTYPSAPPKFPTLTTPTVTSTTAIQWNFTDNADNETGFKLYDLNDNLLKTQEEANSTSTIEDGLSPNTRYQRRFKAYNDNGSSPNAGYYSVYTHAPEPTNLQAPYQENFTFSNVSVDSFSNDDSDSSGYYFWGTNGQNSGWIQENSWQPTNLERCTKYTWHAKYRNGDGVETDHISTTQTTAGCAGPTGDTSTAPSQEENTEEQETGSLQPTSETISSDQSKAIKKEVKTDFYSQLDIPTEAVKTKTQITVQTQEDSSVVGQTVFSYQAQDLESQQLVTAFQKPITIQIKYSDEDIQDYQEDTLVLHYYDEEKQAWTPLDSQLNQEDNLISAQVDHFTLFAIKGQKKQTDFLLDGDLVKNSSAEGLAKFDIYIIKKINDKKYKRLILSPQIFNSYQHLKWSSVKEVNKDTLNNYQTSNLVRVTNQEKVYQLQPTDSDQGQKEWLNLTQHEFLEAYEPDSIYAINQTELNLYD